MVDEEVADVVETVYRIDPELKVHKVLFDGNLHYIHMRFAQGEGLPEHDANGNVYMTVLSGRLSIGLDGLEARTYGSATLLKIPKGTHMNVRNLHPEPLELLVIKAPAPAAG
jgi:quercetin dioxygenase-like cupin family protein